MPVHLRNYGTIGQTFKNDVVVDLFGFFTSIISWSNYSSHLRSLSLKEMKEMSTKSARKTLSEHYKALILFELGQYLGVYSKSTKLARVNLVLYTLLHLTSRVGQRRKNQTIGLWTHIFTNTFQLAIYSKCFCSQEFFFVDFYFDVDLPDLVQHVYTYMYV